MAVRAEAIRALGRDFKTVVGDVVTGVMVHLREDNASDLLGPSLGSLVSRASLKAIVTFALYADVLRVVRDVLLADGEISDDEVRETLPLLATLAAGFAGVRKEYAGYAALRAENAREFLEHYGADTKAFGHADEATKWAGFQVCQKIQAEFNDGGPLGRLGQWLVAWADRVVESNGVTVSERDLLHSLKQQLLPQLQGQRAPATKGSCTVEALDADERDYLSWRSQGRSSSDWLATRHDRIACWIEAAEAADPRGQLFVGLCHGFVRKCIGTTISDESACAIQMRLAAAVAVSEELSLAPKFFLQEDSKEDATEVLNEILGVEQAINVVRKHSGVYDELGCPVVNEDGGQKIFTELAQTILHSAFAAEDDVAAWFEGLDGDLYLGGLTSLSDSVAEFVARHKGTAWLDGLRSLSAKRAKTLAQHEGTLSLNGLLTLSDEAASELACHQGELFLDNVVNVSDRGVEVLGRHGGPVSLKGLQFQKQLAGMRSLTDDIIEHLALYRGDLVLDRLESLTEIEARSVVNRGEILSLNGLVSVSDEVAEVLAQHRGRVSLNGLKALSDAAACALAGLRPLPTDHWPESARKAYETTRSSLSVVLAFVEHPAGVDLSAIERLPPDQARVLSRCGWYLNLTGITEVSDDVAAILGEHVGTLNLPNLRSITEAGVAAISRHQGPLMAPADVVPVDAIAEKAK